jgi:phosphoribosylaminoimidazole-succinocarboxamide synthase
VNQAHKPVELLYEGSVKRVWQSPTYTDRLLFEFTDDYSVFDWGKMPDTIANKGRALALIGAFLFDKLTKPELWQHVADSPHLQKFDHDWLKERFNHRVFKELLKSGAPTHFKSLRQGEERVTDLKRTTTDPEPLFMEVMGALVERPIVHQVLHHNLYFYQERLFDPRQVEGVRRLIPLEVVFRFGMPSGSSLAERLQKDPSYLDVLGISEPKPDGWFERPVLEFFTKLEPKDRLLSWQEATLISGLTGEQFEEMVELSLDTAIALHVIFGDRNIELWDGKVELIIDNGHPKLADSIGPDELRLMHQGCHLSKEIIRQMYRGSVWEKALKEAQALEKKSKNRGWKDIARQDLGAEPEALPPTKKALVDRLYGVVANHLLAAELFADHPSLDGFVRSLPGYFLTESTPMSLVKPARPKAEESN